MSTVGLVVNTPEKTPAGGGGGEGGGNAQFYLEPNSPEVIEMRSGINFTRLPQDPPLTDAMHMQSNGSVVKPGVPTIIAPTVNGTPQHSVDTYGPVPGQRPDTQQAVTSFGHVPPQPSQGVSAPRPERPGSYYKHDYEELPKHRVDLPDHNGSSPYGHNGHHMSHTEMDQAMLFPNSQKVPLNGTGSSEKRPRKKMNPIYDGYQGGTSMPSGRKKMNPHYEGYQPHNKVISTKGSSKPPQHGSPVKQCSQCSVQCLKSPCTTFLVILVVFLMVIAGVLIFMGKITTPATGGSTSELSQPKPSTPNPSYTPILMPIEVQQRLEQQDSQIKQMQEQISMLQTQLQDLLGGSDEDVNASLSTKVVQNARAIMRVEEEQTRQQGSIAGLTASIHNDQQIINTVLGDITNIKSRTANLENNSTILDNQVKVLTAKSETQTTDIRNINNKNENQDTQIIGIESQIALVEQDYKFELRVLNRTIYEELDVISKMQGPRGYNGSQGLMGEPGAGNLTRCVYGTQNNGGPLTQPETSTPWVVAGEGYTFVALTCSSRGGTSTYLATNPNDATQYDCTCTGNNAEREDFRGRDCIIHFWKCPTIT